MCDLCASHNSTTKWPELKSNQTFVTSAEYNKYRPYREMLTYKHLTNSAVQEKLRKYLPNKLK